jgi:hypothetical protein
MFYPRVATNEGDLKSVFIKLPKMSTPNEGNPKRILLGTPRYEWPPIYNPTVDNSVRAGGPGDII